MFDLSGKCVLLTGASGGIGGAIARACVRQGASVALSGTRTQALEALAEELGSAACAVPADLQSAEGCAALASAAEERLGRIDVLVHNAGVTRDNLLLRLSDDDWRTVLDVNLSAAFYLARAALRRMMKRRWGRLIGITSIVGATGNAGQANYAASKAGMAGLFKSVAHEVAKRGITANCIAPGYIETAMTDVLSEEQKRAIVAAVPQARAGTPADVAACVVFLASEEAGYVTGQTLHVNGGMAML